MRIKEFHSKKRFNLGRESYNKKKYSSKITLRQSWNRKRKNVCHPLSKVDPKFANQNFSNLRMSLTSNFRMTQVIKNRIKKIYPKDKENLLKKMKMVNNVLRLGNRNRSNKSFQWSQLK